MPSLFIPIHRHETRPKTNGPRDATIPMTGLPVATLPPCPSVLHGRRCGKTRALWDGGTWYCVRCGAARDAKGA